MDFVAAFWHCECVCGLSEKAFAAKYQEYPVVMGMLGVGPALGPQLMAEIGDLKRRWWLSRILMSRRTSPARWKCAQPRHRQTWLLCAGRCFWRRGQALPRLYDGLRQQVPAHLLRHREAVPGQSRSLTADSRSVYPRPAPKIFNGGGLVLCILFEMPKKYRFLSI